MRLYAPILCLAGMGSIMGLPADVLAQAPTPETQIAMALLAAPEGERDAAAVLGYAASGKLITLRPGRNDLVCLTDDPADEGFSVACYHESLEPYMARGRELREEGVTDGNERNRLRWQEADAGTLAMPKAPATLYVLTGSSYDPASGNVADEYLRFVLYVPWATKESTGMTDAPMGPGTPWLMYPGTAGAHIMISPPRQGGGR